MKKLIAFALMAATSSAFAGDATIEDVSARQSGGAWTFSVTIRHDDTGWEHYVDTWTVNTTDGKLLGERALAHPHENEQPFTRSLSGVAIPAGTDEVIVRVRDNADGWSKNTYTVKLK